MVSIKCSFRLVLASIACALTCSSPAFSQEQRISFSQDIRPILSDYCFACHGPDATHRKGGSKKLGRLRLDTKSGAFADHGDFAAVVPGDTDESELVYRIKTDDKDEIMPPPDFGKPLTDKQKQLLVDWIKQGATWEEHWSFAPIQRKSLPAVKNKAWPTTFIDHYTLARMESEGLKPSPEAGRATLIRRLSFDLTGLPPSPEEVDRFVKDRSPDAYKKVVDRLLASPRFGERMAMYWLDLVRYADTVGYHGDQDHNASPYRDWVIEAFNRNMPFDDFTTAQIAGDLVAAANPKLPYAEIVDLKVASAYNRLLQTSHEGGVQAKEYLAIYAADRVRNLSGTWLGATLGCAQCHDHKYDPFTSKDHYAMAAFFADVDEAKHFKNGSNSLPTRRDPEIRVIPKLNRNAWAALTPQIDALQAKLNPIVAKLKQANAELKKVSGIKNVTIRKKAEAKHRALISTLKSQSQVIDKQLTPLKKRKATLETGTRSCMVTASIAPRTMRVLPRGNWLDDSGAIVQPAVPEFMGSLNVKGRATRLHLAKWITSPDNPLTSRAFTNRLWAMFFGRGISPDLLDLGGQGQPPTHPALLDALADEFVKNKWNVKHVARLIVLSSTYQQTSDTTKAAYLLDPLNTRYARQTQRRLQAEMIRDNYLAVSGLLVESVGGGRIKPYQPAGYYQHMNFPVRRYSSNTDDRQWRRGVYFHWQRQFLHPMLKAFDAPTREECTAQRPVSNTPLAALTLLNDPSSVEAARVFAQHILDQQGKTDAQRLGFAFRRAFSRTPADAEIKLMTALLQDQRKHYKANPEEAKKLVAAGLAPRSASLDVAELAAWTSVARTIFNTDEFITRD